MRIPSFINLCCDLWSNFYREPTNIHATHVTILKALCHSWKDTQTIYSHMLLNSKGREGRHWQKVDDGALPLFLWGSAWGSLACLNCSEAHCCRDELQPVSPDRECKRGITGGGQHGQQAGTRKEGKHTPHLDASHHLTIVIIRL